MTHDPDPHPVAHDPRLFRPAHRLAGVLYVGQGVLSALTSVLLARGVIQSGSTMLTGGGATTWVLRALISILLGVLLLRRRLGALLWARLAAALSLMLETSELATSHNPLLLVDMALTISILSLLLGTPGRVRTGTAAALGTVVLLVLGYERVAVLAGLPIPAALRVIETTAVSAAVSRLTGSRYTYTIELPAHRWRRPARAGLSLPPETDDFVVWPARDIGLLVMGERVPEDSALAPAGVMFIVNSALRKSLESYEVVDSEPLELSDGDGVMMHSRFVHAGQRVERLHGIYVSKGQVVQVMITASDAVFPEVEQDLRQILESVKVGPPPRV